MRFGICTGTENLKLAEQNGYEYFETSLGWVAGLSMEEFNSLRQTVAATPVKLEAFNCFIPGHLKITGEAVEAIKLIDYVKFAVDRVQRLEGRIIVFGSGGARNVPENFPREAAWEQLVEFLGRVSEIISGSDITIVIEPLQAAECNIINTVKEGWELARKVNRSNIRLLADFYHMALGNDPINSIKEAGTEYIKHIHIANPEGRSFPKKTDHVDYRAWFTVLQEIGYTGRVSIEGNAKEWDMDLAEAMEVFRSVEDI